MKLTAYILAMVLALPLLTTSAHADACSNAARNIVNNDPKATLLSVKSTQDNKGRVICEARIKISSGNNPPRIIVKKFKP